MKCKACKREIKDPGSQLCLSDDKLCTPPQEARTHVTEDQWRQIAVVALADLDALGMDLSVFLKHQSNADAEEVLKEVDRYMWNRAAYT